MSPALRRGLVLLLLLAAALLPIANAHEVRPGYLEIRQVDAEAFDVLWKVPAKGEYRLSLHARLPKECTGAPNQGSFVGGAFVERWRATCPGGLVGRAIDIEGLSATRTDVLARIEWCGRHDPGRPSDARADVVRGRRRRPVRSRCRRPISCSASSTSCWASITCCSCWDCCSWSATGSAWSRTVTAFTVAHSITLAAATLGLVHVAQAPVEATIALSIMFVAAEIIHGAHGQPRLATRAPWLVAFVFGLLHGFGFAGALREIGLPQKDVPLALLFFNVGVEVGQLLFIAAVVAVFSVLTRLLRQQGSRDHGPWHSESLIRTPVAYAIGSVAAFWTVQRVVGFWP